jgi:hypothetical protein
MFWKKYTLFIVGCLSSMIGLTQDITIRGIVSDLQNTPIAAAKVVEITKMNGTFTDENGRFELIVEKGENIIEVRSIDHKTQRLVINISKDTSLSIQLETIAGLQELSEVVVSGIGRDQNIQSTKIGNIQLEMKEIRSLPAFMGEYDIIRTLQFMPGVQSASEGTQGLYVRGGGPEQNLVLLDGTHVYNATHLFGFFSVFNADAIQDVELTKVGMPAQYGGRISSVLDIRSRQGGREKIGIQGGIGLLSSRVAVDGPFANGKGDFLVAGRRTYLDLLLTPFIPEESGFAGTGYYFYDLNANLNYKINDNNKISISSYLGEDEFSFRTDSENFSVDMPWGNAIANVRWRSILSDQTLLNVSAGISDYQFEFLSFQDQFEVGLSSGIRDYIFKADVSHSFSPRHQMRFGGEYIYHRFTPIAVSANQGDVEFDTGEGQVLFSHESALFVTSTFDWSERFKTDIGYRHSFYHFVGPFTRYIASPIGFQQDSIFYENGELIKAYHFAEPRFSARYLINSKSAIKAGWNYNAQYVHLANISTVSLPTDIWFPTTDIAGPQHGWQAALGYFRNFLDNSIETSVEVYYKHMNNVVEFKDGALPQDNTQDNTDNLLTLGQGYSYGAEFFIRKNFGLWTGWLGYTLSRTERRFEDINDGNFFPARHDRRHDFSAVMSYRLNDNWTFGLSMVYATGNAITLPNSWYLHNGDVQFEFGDRNMTRMPAYHRLDLSATWFDKPTKDFTDPITGITMQVQKKWRHSVNFSIYNVYNRQNPFFLFVQNDGSLVDNNFNISLQQVALFPILPSITWNFEF